MRVMPSSSSKHQALSQKRLAQHLCCIHAVADLVGRCMAGYSGLDTAHDESPRQGSRAAGA